MSFPAMSAAAKVKFTVTGTLSPEGAPKTTLFTVTVIVPGGIRSPVVASSRCSADALLAWPEALQSTQVSWAVAPAPGAPGVPGVPAGPVLPSSPLQPKKTIGATKTSTANPTSALFIFPSVRDSQWVVG